MKKIITVVIILLVIVIGFFVYKNNTRDTSNTIRVGALLSLTGGGSAWGENAQKGIALAVEEINKNGGINGKQIEMIYEDTASDPKQTVSAFQHLVSFEHVMAIIGPLNQTEVGAVNHLIEQEGIPSVIPGFFPLRDRKNIKNPIFVWADAENEAGRLAEYVYNKGVHNVGVIGTLDSWEKTVSDAFIEKFKAIGGVITGTEIVQPSASDMKLPVTKIIATKPDAIYLGTYYEFVNSMKEIHNLGFSGKLYSIEVDDYLAGETSEWSDKLQFIAPDYYKNDFIKKYSEKYSIAPGLPVGQSYDAAHILFSFLQENQNKSGILSIMKDFKEYDGVSGKLTITSDGRTNLPLAIFQLEKGKINKNETLQ